MSEVSPSPGSLLVVEDDEDFAASLEMILEGEGYELTLCRDGAVALEHAREFAFDAVITDFRLPGMGGMELLERLRTEQPQRPIILMTAHGKATLAIEAMGKGAFDYLLKPFDVDELLATVERSVRAGRSMQRPVALGGDGLETETDSTALIGDSRSMQKVYKEIGRLAPTDSPVLILGATGTGKELVARALYQHSRRAGKPFVAVNCGAIAEGLLESELFGHEKGAFTGAVTARIGRFEQADGGTLFLDEIGDMPLDVQVKLLRVLQDGSIQKVGGRGERTVDVRVIAATHRPIRRLVDEQKFREDLYYRLSEMRIELPALSERPEDVPLLARAFIARAATDFGIACPKLGAELSRKLAAQPWPGNVRQLQNVIRHAVLHSGGYGLTGALVDEALAGDDEASNGGGDDESTARGFSLDRWVGNAVERARKHGSGAVHAELVAELEQEMIEIALQMAAGHLGKVCEWLGLSRVTLRKKMSDYGIRRDAV